MIKKKQILISLVLILVATGVTWSQIRDGGGTEGQGEMEGHNHAAMTAGSEG
ncbi:MAG: hypothetical protein GWM92_04245, partial [Gemmatimonadetes bacterium]|nr:hypothetical protein [Gemmatimonadota bacterium]NIR77771.1 hypothetical protein [Gemmatimonadota bacterium]NIT86307.1 hypothetical protein [Gemmatimonadota bacterium]NIU30141.1 hypothetical protein [Gemmatimonadota bacterium]NIU35081.1 hypothetical protein [Gemmatimonadota bacterium]